ncbi:MAG: hypothetical protein KC621_05555 [Myxococcales bacterium]|nr:hypothetical protein [Myxococcales bacterium]MCB9689813.1 hypothetical protein [Alphaproteobacteria bacterium]
MQTLTFGSPGTWGRDFGLVGAATGAAAPLFVIFDPTFALVAGVVGGVTGVLLGALSGWVVPLLRPHVPLPALVAGMAAAGSLWGAVAGTLGGAASLWFGLDGAPLGFVLGGCTGMVALGLFFLPYLVLSVRREPTWPAVAGAVLLAPVMGWLGLAALLASTFGLWLFALPAVVWAAVAVDRSARQLPVTSRLLLDGRAR